MLLVLLVGQKVDDVLEEGCQGPGNRNIKDLVRLCDTNTNIELVFV